MTKETIDKGIALIERIGALRGKEKELKYARGLYCGDTIEVDARRFRISIGEGMHEIAAVNISPSLMMATLDKELEGVGKELAEANAALETLWMNYDIEQGQVSIDEIVKKMGEK